MKAIAFAYPIVPLKALYISCPTDNDHADQDDAKEAKIYSPQYVTFNFQKKNSLTDNG